MATPVIPDEGKSNIGGQLLKRITAGGQNCLVHLFANPITPNAATVLGDLVEASFDGYAPVQLLGPVDAGVDIDDNDVWILEPVSWLVTGPGGLPTVVYGYWVDCDSAFVPSTKLLWVKALDVPLGLSALGQSFQFVPSVSFGQLA